MRIQNYENLSVFPLSKISLKISFEFANHFAYLFKSDVFWPLMPHFVLHIFWKIFAYECHSWGGGAATLGNQTAITKNETRSGK